MAAFHIRRDPTQNWRWRLVADDGRVLAISPGFWPTRGETETAINLVRRELAAADDIIVNTTVPDSRWRGIDMVTGQIQPGPAPEPEDDGADEGETGPPEVDLGGYEHPDPDKRQWRSTKDPGELPS